MAAPVMEAVEALESHLHPTPSFAIDDHPYPKGQEEIWRFSPLRAMKALLTDEPSDACLTWAESYPEGVTTRVISTAEAQLMVAEAPIDRVSALAAARSGGAQVIEVPANAELTEPVSITLSGTGQHVWGHLVFSIGAHSSSTILLRHEGSASYATKVDVLVGDGARVNFVSIQDWDDDAVHGGHHSVLVGRDAQVRTVTVSLGGKVVRLAETAKFAGPGGSLEQFGLYFVDAGQHIEHRLFVDHNAPHTHSNVDYRGALQGEGARSVWIGDVLIRKAAEGIDTYESNKNLLLTEGCKVDSVPNLEIETGEIEGAGHSSSTGRFDELQLFYLRSRGIPEREARRLVVHGFFWDIIRRIGVDDIEGKLLERVEHEIESVEAAGAAE